jgi:dihydrofolate reductase
MIVSAIAAIDRSGLMGRDMKMPWHLPRDLRRFREHTIGKPVIMGRRTLESLRAPLPSRLNIVLSHNRSFEAKGCCVALSIEEALKIAEDFCGTRSIEDVMIIGGGVVFQETVHLWDRLLLTVVEGDFQGETYFPLHKTAEARWRLVRKEYWPADAKNAYLHRFLILERQNVDSAEVEDFDLFAWLADPSGPVAELPLTHR